MSYHNLVTSKADQCARTPDSLYDFILTCFSLGSRDCLFDPCPTGPTFDGLSVPWPDGVVYCNPPYSDAKLWLAKANTEVASNENTVVILLLPARGHTRYAHEHVFASPHTKHILLLGNSLTFKGYLKPLPLPLWLIVLAKSAVPITLNPRAFKLPCGALALPYAEATLESAITAIKHKHASFLEGADVVVMRQEHALTARRVLDRHAAGARVMVLCPCMWHANWHKDLARVATHVEFIGPCLRMDEGQEIKNRRCTVGTLAMLLGEAPLEPSADVAMAITVVDTRVPFAS